jgi:hypothetical protein
MASCRLTFSDPIDGSDPVYEAVMLAKKHGREYVMRHAAAALLDIAGKELEEEFADEIAALELSDGDRVAITITVKVAGRAIAGAVVS